MFSFGHIDCLQTSQSWEIDGVGARLIYKPISQVAGAFKLHAYCEEFRSYSIDKTQGLGCAY